MPVPPQRNPWRSRFRSLAFAVGVGTSFYLVTSYALDRMRESRLKLSKERNAKDLLKRSFNAALSSSSYTLYALLPTLSEQLNERYDVEAVSAELQTLSASQSTAASSTATPAASQVLEQPVEEQKPTEDLKPASGHTLGPGESWASEFRSDASEGAGTDLHMSVSELGTEPETDDQFTNSSISQTISLPTSSASVSSASESMPSPEAPPPQPLPSKTKAELWNELKIKSITRSLITIYLLPLLLLLTQSQLTLLARVHYLRTVRESLPTPQSPAKKSGWLSYLSVEGMGLSEFAESSSAYLPIGLGSVIAPKKSTLPSLQEEEQAEPAIDQETERLFLCFSWWLLNEGWKGVADRVEGAVRDEFASLPLKRELSVEDWKNKLESVRARIETDDELPGSTMYNFLPHLLPPASVPDGAPFPSQPYPAVLENLHAETKSHLESTDFNLVFSLGIKKLADKLSEEVYGEHEKKRLVDCLPGVTRWGRSVWDAIPDVGVEELLAIPELEAFAALIFGDWAVDLDA